MRGFTLLELIVVLTLMSILLAVTAPRLAGRSQEAAVRGVGLDLQNLAATARARSVMAERPVGLLVDAAVRRLRVVAYELGQNSKADVKFIDLLPPRAWPEGCEVSYRPGVEHARDKLEGLVLFRPDGSVSEGDIVVTGKGVQLHYRLIAPLGSLRLAPAS